jgi:hypothetical protein
MQVLCGQIGLSVSNSLAYCALLVKQCKFTNATHPFSMPLSVRCNRAVAPNFSQAAGLMRQKNCAGELHFERDSHSLTAYFFSKRHFILFEPTD